MSSAETLTTRNGIEMPLAPPKKRRALESADAKWLAMWANDETLPPSARKRAQDERDRRKQQTGSGVVTVLEDDGGATPDQVRKTGELLVAWSPAVILQPFVSKSLNHAIKIAATGEVLRDRDMDVMLGNTDRLIGLPNGSTMPERKDEGIWKLLRRAKDRDVDVTIVWADGSVLSGRW